MSKAIAVVAILGVVVAVIVWQMRRAAGLTGPIGFVGPQEAPVTSDAPTIIKAVGITKQIAAGVSGVVAAAHGLLPASTIATSEGIATTAAVAPAAELAAPAGDVLASSAIAPDAIISAPVATSADVSAGLADAPAATSTPLAGSASALVQLSSAALVVGGGIAILYATGLVGGAPPAGSYFAKNGPHDYHGMKYFQPGDAQYAEFWTPTPPDACGDPSVTGPCFSNGNLFADADAAASAGFGAGQY